MIFMVERQMRFRILALAPLAVAGVLVAGCTPTALGSESATKFERVFELKPNEGVFAYSRISPDGRTLAYASEISENGRISQTVTVVDLASKKVVFAERGIDAYFSNDSKRIIFSSQLPGQSGVSIRNEETGAITRNAAPAALGDYYSWSVRDGRNLIMTIQSNYYYLDGDKAVMPSAHVTSCPGIGTGDRPLISKDGR
jgi:Tol biopolymer transport system component